MTGATVVRDPEPSLITATQATYALHALGLAIGAFGAATVVGSFIFGWPSIIAVIINYVKARRCPRHVAGVSLSWQIRTFWWSLWAIIISIVSFPLAFLLIGFVTWPVGMFILGVWAIYRIAVGWSRLSSGRTVP